MMRIEHAALRWHAAREKRLGWQRKVNDLPALLPARLAYERARVDAKRIETRALRELAKACAESRTSLEVAEEGRSLPRLPHPDVIDI